MPFPVLRGWLRLRLPRGRPEHRLKLALPKEQRFAHSNDGKMPALNQMVNLSRWDADKFCRSPRTSYDVFIQHVKPSEMFYGYRYIRIPYLAGASLGQALKIQLYPRSPHWN